MGIDRAKAIKVIGVVEEAMSHHPEFTPEDIYTGLECILAAIREKHGFLIKVDKDVDSDAVKNALDSLPTLPNPGNLN